MGCGEKHLKTKQVIEMVRWRRRRLRDEGKEGGKGGRKGENERGKKA